MYFLLSITFHCKHIEMLLSLTCSPLVLQEDRMRHSYSASSGFQGALQNWLEWKQRGECACKYRLFCLYAVVLDVLCADCSLPPPDHFDQSELSQSDPCQRRGSESVWALEARWCDNYCRSFFQVSRKWKCCSRTKNIRYDFLCLSYFVRFLSNPYWADQWWPFISSDIIMWTCVQLACTEMNWFVSKWCSDIKPGENTELNVIMLQFPSTWWGIVWFFFFSTIFQVWVCAYTNTEEEVVFWGQVWNH